MIANLYSPAASRPLAASVVAGARASVTTRLDEPHVLGIGGTWQQATWREDLRRAGGHGRPVVAVGLRAPATDRVLSDHDWTDISRRLADHSGLSGSPWVAVRTGLRSALLLARTDLRPDPAQLRAFTADVERNYHLTRAGTPGTAGAGPAADSSPRPAGTPAQAFPALAPTTANPGDGAAAPAAQPPRHAARGR